ncbi:MAG: hypothetical protein JNJ45_08040 [Chthonomonas sp.]|nr:hypothetical protein [Chthonomonas sp.]
MRIVPSNLVQLAAVGLVLAAGCARYPNGGGGAATTRLTFTMNTDGPVRFGTESGAAGVPYIYMVAIRTSNEVNPITQGPVPIIAPPWGNGFVAGGATHFVWWDPTQSSAQYTLYRFVDDTLQQWTSVGIPVNVDVASPGDARLRFEVDLAQLEPDPLLRVQIRSVQVNFLTMDRIPQSGTSKNWDALGDGRLPSEVNTWITVPIQSDRLVNNSNSGLLEPRGDQAEPALDLVDWQIEVSVN